MSGWSLSNLTMQKVLYIAQMIHLGRTGKPVFPEAFEAWGYGPVAPALYHVAKRFKAAPVEDIFTVDPFPDDSSEAQAVRDAWATTQHLRPSQLVAYTHRDGGAWESHYREGQRGNVIPNSAIFREWGKSVRPSDEAAEWAMQVARENEVAPARYLDSEGQRAFRARLRQRNCH
jgi:uncharacterized phage-associated protein